MTDQARHMDVKFPERHQVAKLVNQARFPQISEMPDDVFEVYMAKKILIFNLPCQLGFFVYCYAKLRMLEFYYDFLMCL